MSKFTKIIGPFIPKPIERKIRDIRDRYLRTYKHVELPQEIYEGPFKKVSYVTTCMNRLFHLKQTYKQNIEDNIDYPEVEFVLLNYNSGDELHEWVYENLMDYIKSGKLKYYKTFEPEHFNVSKAKNLVARLAEGDIVCNLDGDNFLGKGNAFYINHLYKNEWNTLFHFYKMPFWGTAGRMVIPTELFYELGGYNEEFLPLGFEDFDFRNRAKAYGVDYKKVQIDNFLHYLSNSQKERTENVSSNPRYIYDCIQENKKVSEDDIKNGRLVVNTRYGWGAATVYKNFDETPMVLDKIFPEAKQTSGIKDVS